MEPSTLIKAIGDGESSEALRREGKMRWTEYRSYLTGITFLGNQETISFHLSGLFASSA